MLEVNQGNFKEEVLKGDKPVLIDFWAPWCMPCKIMAPAVEALKEEFKDTIRVGKVNVDDNPELANELSIMNIPTLVLFKDGQEVSRIIGVNSKEAIAQKIKTAIG